MGVVHSSPDTNCVQEVKQLEKQRNEAKDEKEKEEIEETLVLERQEKALAQSNCVRQRTLPLGQMMYAMKWALVVCSGVCGEQLLTPCLCKGCSVCSVHLH